MTIATCPVCSSQDHKTLFPRFSGQCITSDMMVLPQAEIENRLCRSCGLIHNAGGTRGITENFYRESYRLMLQSPNASIQSFAGPRPISQAERSYQLLREMVDLPEAGRVLEAGAGKGEFLEHLTVGMPAWEVLAFEPSAAHDVLREKLPRAKVQRCEYQQFNLEPNSLDLVIALGVLEHVENPLDMLQWGAGLLKKGGFFFIRVPNFVNNPNDLFCADHLSKLTLPTLRALALAAGFEVTAVKEAGVPIFVALRSTGRRDSLGNAFPENEASANRNVDIAQRSMSAVLTAVERSTSRNESMAVFGLGSSGLFAPLYAGFDPSLIAAYLDENKSVWGGEIHGRPVGGLDLISELSIRHVALAISPVYVEQVSQKLQPYGVEIYSA